MHQKYIMVDLGDDKHLFIKFIKDVETGDWHSTMTDECMHDLWFYYPQVFKEAITV